MIFQVDMLVVCPGGYMALVPAAIHIGPDETHPLYQNNISILIVPYQLIANVMDIHIVTYNRRNGNHDSDST